VPGEDGTYVHEGRVNVLSRFADTIAWFQYRDNREHVARVFQCDTQLGFPF